MKFFRWKIVNAMDAPWFISIKELTQRLVALEERVSKLEVEKP